MADKIDIDPRAAEALGLTRTDRKAIADRLAEVGALRTPTRQETETLLVEVLVSALREIPSGETVWSWGEFHNGGLQPLYDMTRDEDWPRMALCAADLGLDDQYPKAKKDETLTPRVALSRNLIEATERLLGAVRERLDATGLSP